MGVPDGGSDLVVKNALLAAFPGFRDIDSRVGALPVEVKWRILDLLCNGPFETGKSNPEIPVDEVRSIYANYLRNPTLQ